MVYILYLITGLLVGVVGGLLVTGRREAGGQVQTECPESSFRIFVSVCITEIYSALFRHTYLKEC